MNRVIRSYVPVIVAAAILLPNLLQGAPRGASHLEAPPPGRANLTIGPRSSYAFPADLEGSHSGDVGIARYSMAGTYDVPSEPGSFLTLNGGIEYTRYDWSDAGFFDETRSIGLSMIGLRRIGDSNWGVFGFGRIGWATETSDLLDRGFSSTLGLGPAYSFSPCFTVYFGGIVTLGPERGSRFFPAAGVNWRINEKWTLRTLNGAMLTYFPDPERRLKLDFFTEYRTNRIRLRRQLLPDNTIDRPAVEEREIAVGAGAAWRMSEAVTVRGFAEYLLAREWRFRADGKRFRTVDAENSPRVGVDINFAF